MRSILFAMILLAGCVTTRGQADFDYTHGDYLGAAELLDKVVAANPGDRDAIAQRETARDHALAHLVGAYRAAPSPAAAAGDLAEVLAHRDAWGRTVDMTLEVEQTGKWIAGEVAARTQAAGPLAGEAVEHTYAALLAHADFRQRRAAITTVIGEAAQARCTALATGTPYLTALADRYCGHFGIARNDAQPLPELRGGLSLEGDIAGATDAQNASLATALSAAFHDSAWYGPGAPVIAAHLDGSIAQTRESHAVQLTKNWSETESYQEDETHDETDQEPYQDTEVVTSPGSCGDPSCEESTTRSVTKYRLVTNKVTTSVTKYRDVPYSYQYAATQVTAHDFDALHVTTPLADAAVDEDFTQSGYDHDVTYAPAKLAPQRANLLSLPALMARAQDQLRARLRANLDAKWAERFCSAPAYTTEAAAQCIYGDRTHAPAAAHAALATVFGGDEPFVTSVL